MYNQLYKHSYWGGLRMAKQLLVIGNGFDRWCRLESSFSQFMDDRVSKSPRIYTDIKRYMNGETISPKRH